MSFDLDVLFDELKKDELKSRKKNEPTLRDLVKKESLLNDVYFQTIKNALYDPKNNEVEISFGKFILTKDSKYYFDNSFSIREFMNLKSHLEEEIGVLQLLQQSTVYTNKDIRKIHVEGGKTWYEQKTKNAFIDEHLWGWRMRASTEKTIDPKEINFEFDDTNSYVRNRRRFSFKFIEKGIILDLTIVNGARYEVEMELVKKDITKETIEYFINYVYSRMKDTFSLSDVHLNKHETLSVIKNYNNLLKFRKNVTYIYPLMNKPIPLKPSSILNNVEYSITPKFDGVRKNIYFDKSGVYSISIDSSSVEYISKTIPAYDGTVIECEFFNNIFYPFDVICYKGELVTKNNFLMRKEIFEKIKAPFVDQKPFFEGKGFITNVRECFKWMDKHKELEYDGFIAQPSNMEYDNKTTLKWKPLDKLSIDLRVNERGDLLMGDVNGERKFTLYSHIAGLTINHLNNIVEFKLKEKNVLEPLRIRSDKGKPNFVKTVMGTWNLMHNPITKKDLLGETMFMYRKWANISKQNLISHNIKGENVNVLDIGIGRGGDINKWSDKINTVYGIDVDLDNLKELSSRLKKSTNSNVQDKFKVEAVGGEETEKIKRFVGNAQIDVVSSFFSLTFFPKSEEMYNGLFNTIDQMLEVGGKFIGITMDGGKTKELFDKTKKKVVKTDLYSIKKGTTTNEIIIDIPGTMVSSQTEYLVDFDQFKGRMKHLGFELVSDGFIDNEVLGGVSSEFASMQRKFVFERMSKNKERVVKPLKLGEEKEYGEFLRLGVVEGNNSFFHSFYFHMSKKYKKLYEEGNETELNKFICKKRKAASKKLTKEMFSSLMEGNVEHNIAYDLLYSSKEIDSSKIAKKNAFKKYVKMIKECKEWVGYELSEMLVDDYVAILRIIDSKGDVLLETKSDDNDTPVFSILMLNNTSFEPLV